jgi:hypothetical protein
MYGTLVQGFANYSGQPTSGSYLLAVLMLAVVVVIQLFVVRFLWNNVLVRVTTIAKPIPSLLYALGLLVLVAMILPGSVLG